MDEPLMLMLVVGDYGGYAVMGEGDDGEPTLLFASGDAAEATAFMAQAVTGGLKDEDIEDTIGETVGGSQ